VSKHFQAAHANGQALGQAGYESRAMNPKDLSVLILTIGLVGILVFIVLFDFAVAIKIGRPPDDEVIELLKMSMTGLVGIIAGYLAAGKSD
jgi:hypothetical protein